MKNIAKNFDFKVIDGKATITKYRGTDTEVVIPSEICDLSVTNIENCAFSGCSSLTYITIPNSVTRIGNWAFENCSSLMSVEIPDSVTRIGYSAFENCSSLASVTIPNSVTRIGNWAFENCSSLMSVEIPDSVTRIWEYAFGYCYDNGYKKIDGFTIKGTKGSEAERYANENGFVFVELSY